MNLIEEYIGVDILFADLMRLSYSLSASPLTNNLLRLSYPINDISILQLLVTINSSNKYYWKSRNNLIEIIGFEYFQTSDDNKPIPYWYISPFTSGSLSNSNIDCGIVVPEWGIFRKDNIYTLYLNINSSIISNIISDYQTFILRFNTIEYDNKYTAPSNYIHNPEIYGWEKNINKCLHHFESGNLQKIVMARETCFNFAVPNKPEAIFMKIASKSNSSFLFYIQQEPSTAFFGDSPEELFSIQNNTIFADALAGTRPRGNNIDEDDKYSNELISSPKELEEHNFVVNFIKNQLSDVCESINCPNKPVVKKFNTVQHLFTPISGELKTGKCYIDALNALHPTPAVSGFPQELAIDIIHELEPFDRGLYAGAIGIVLENSCEFAVGIRSGLFKDGKLYLYSGAGIVPGSTPQDEWDEINYKLENLKGRL